MKKLVLIFVLSILLVGCGSTKINEANISMYCNDTKTEVKIKEKDIVSCKLLGEEYKFKINKISNDKIDIESNEYGLTSDNNLREKNKKFSLSKNDTLRLTTQSTDYQESVIFEWKE